MCCVTGPQRCKAGHGTLPHGENVSYVCPLGRRWHAGCIEQPSARKPNGKAKVDDMRLNARIFLAAAVLPMVAVGFIAEAQAQAAADFFAGKTVSLLIGTTPGGGYDAYARALARHLGHHIPGNPGIIVKNMPGAGGLALANHLYNRAPTDGTEIATVQNGLPFEKLFYMLSPGGNNALFDSTKFGWI